MSTTVPNIDIKQLTEPASAIEAYMSAYLDERALPENLRDAAKYALLGGGKRMRPILVARCCQAVGGKLEQALPPAAAIELTRRSSANRSSLASAGLLRLGANL